MWEGQVSGRESLGTESVETGALARSPGKPGLSAALSLAGTFSSGASFALQYELVIPSEARDLGSCRRNLRTGNPVTPHV
jgi:hypothetical protein